MTLSDFSQDSVQENFSRGKLKVFFKGETADHRFFSDDFAEQVIKTLPYTPVVSSYDAEKDDFVGHAKEQQIFGIVDPCTEPVFEEMEDGKVWCVTDVVLYTERPDTVGKLAKKIIGQPHSLELNPKTVKYVINYDEKKHFKNIEFTAGDFVGVSVLGKDQKPAFTGSAFFACDENFEAKMKILREYCESKNDQSQIGGEDMNLQEFMKLSWGDISTKVDEAICSEYRNDAYTYVVDMFEDSAIVRFYYYVEDCCKLMRVRYTCNENGDVTLGAINEVRMTYIDIESPEDTTVEINMGQVENNSTDAVSEVTETNADNSEDDKSDTFAGTTDEENKNPEQPKEPQDDEGKVGQAASSEDKQKDDKENKDDKDDNDSEVEPEDDEDDKENKKDDFIVDEPSVEDSDPAHVTNVEITPTISEASVEDEQQQTIQETSTASSTSFAESEREEFEALKREKKVGLVNSYKDSLTEEQFDNFMSQIDTFSIKDLELELLKAYKASQEEIESNKPIRAFAFAPINAKQENESPLDAFVRKNKRH